MDSAALLHMVFNQFSEVHAVSFDYGQRHRKELRAAAAIVERLTDMNEGAYIWHDIIPLKAVHPFLKGSSLTDDIEVPEGHYTEEAARSTVVPNRNMMMLSVAIALSVVDQADILYTGVHAGDHYVYPDCRPEFVHYINQAAQAGNEGFAKRGFHIEAPFLHMEKSEIAKVGERYDTPWDMTWSCYLGGAHHCGRCPTCVERAEAFWVAGVMDPTVYDDKEYWKTKSKVYHA